MIKAIIYMVIIGLIVGLLKDIEFRIKKKRYIEVYLKSEEWKRKRAVALKRDNYNCVLCNNQATQVHHKRYARYNIGKEPIEWLISVCDACHKKLHVIKS